MKYATQIQHTPWGYRLEVYTDDDGASGCGENAKVGYWYGNRQACAALDPAEVTLYPMSDESGVDEFDLACERRHDYAEGGK